MFISFYDPREYRDIGLHDQSIEKRNSEMCRELPAPMRSEALSSDCGNGSELQSNCKGSHATTQRTVEQRSFLFENDKKP